MKATPCFAALFLLLSSGVALAQVPPAQPAAPDLPQLTVRAHRNVVRYDVIALFARNRSRVVYGETSFPLLLSYERQISGNFSGNVEVLLNANDSKDHITGLGLQLRYYIPQARYTTGLTGFYVAPTLSTRRVKQSDRVLLGCYGPNGYTPGGRSRALGGAGLLVGRQTPIGKKGRFLVDASVGLMSWQPWNKSAAPYGCPGTPNDFRKYERHTLVPDGRLSLGYRF